MFATICTHCNEKNKQQYLTHFIINFHFVVGHPYNEYNNTHLFHLHIQFCICIQHKKGKYLL